MPLARATDINRGLNAAHRSVIERTRFRSPIEVYKHRAFRVTFKKQQVTPALDGRGTTGLVEFASLLNHIDWRRVFFTFAMLALATVAAATSWKMFEFHDRLINLENSSWERKLAAQHVYQHPIVLFGDSEIAGWPMAQSFGALPVLNRGVNGDRTAQATERFERDVLGLDPRIVVILIGTNDVAHGETPAAIVERLEAMIRRLPAHTHVLLCGLLPAAGDAASARPRERSLEINSDLEELAVRHHAEYVDFGPVLADDLGQFSDGLTDDGLHPNSAGYLRMTEVLLPKLLPLALTASAQ